MQLLGDNNTTTHEINIELVNMDSTLELFNRVRKLKRDLKHIRVLGVQESIIRTSMSKIFLVTPLFILSLFLYSSFFCCCWCDCSSYDTSFYSFVVVEETSDIQDITLYLNDYSWYIERKNEEDEKMVLKQRGIILQCIFFSYDNLTKAIGLPLLFCFKKACTRFFPFSTNR
jgi:hypothetical protein